MPTDGTTVRRRSSAAASPAGLVAAAVAADAEADAVAERIESRSSRWLQGLSQPLPPRRPALLLAMPHWGSADLRCRTLTPFFAG